MEQNIYPKIFKSSPRALFGKYLPKFCLVFALIGVSLVIPDQIALLISDQIVFYLRVAIAIASLFFCLNLVVEFLRLSNTEYKLYSNRIEEYSCVFRFLGVRNNLVNLREIRQIEAFNNSYLDLWLFGCGIVRLTVAGDLADFEIKNVYRPGSVKKQIVKVCFGDESIAVDPSKAND